jgi:hypothetical protein
MFGGEIEKKLGLFAGHGRSARKEVVYGFAMLQVIEKHLNGNPSPGEAGGAAHALRIDPHDLMQLGLLFHFHASYREFTRKAQDAQAEKLRSRALRPAIDAGGAGADSRS